MRVAVRTALTIMQWVFGACLYLTLVEVGSRSSDSGVLIFCALSVPVGMYLSWLLSKLGMDLLANGHQQRTLLFASTKTCQGFNSNDAERVAAFQSSNDCAMPSEEPKNEGAIDAGTRLIVELSHEDVINKIEQRVADVIRLRGRHRLFRLIFYFSFLPAATVLGLQFAGVLPEPEGVYIFSVTFIIQCLLLFLTGRLIFPVGDTHRSGPRGRT